MPPTKNGGNGIWRHTSSALAGVLLTLFSVWASGGFSGITRDDAVILVDTHSPYVEDRKILFESVKANSAAIADLAREQRKHSAQVAELIGEFRAARR